MGRNFTILISPFWILFALGCSKYTVVQTRPDIKNLIGEWRLLHPRELEFEPKILIHDSIIEYFNFPKTAPLRSAKGYTEAKSMILPANGTAGSRIRIQPAGYGFEIEGTKIQIVERGGVMYLRQLLSPHFEKSFIYYRK